MRDATEEVEQSNARVSDSFTIEAIDVATMLGVSRTRLSQITSRGDLSFSRRKVGTRMRIFYNAQEVEAYARTREEAAHFRSTNSQALLIRGQPQPADFVPSQHRRQGAHSFSGHGKLAIDDRRGLCSNRTAEEANETAATQFSKGTDVADRLSRIERSVDSFAASLARIPIGTRPRAVEQTEQRLSRDQLVKLERQMHTLETRLEELHDLVLRVQEQSASLTRQILTRMASVPRDLAASALIRRPLQTPSVAKCGADSADNSQQSENRMRKRRRPLRQTSQRSRRRKCI